MSHLVSLRSSLILFPCPAITIEFFSSIFQITVILCTYHTATMHTTCLAHIFLLDIDTLIIYGEELNCRSWIQFSLLSYWFHFLSFGHSPHQTVFSLFVSWGQRPGLTPIITGKFIFVYIFYGYSFVARFQSVYNFVRYCNIGAWKPEVWSQRNTSEMSVARQRLGKYSSRSNEWIHGLPWQRTYRLQQTNYCSGCFLYGSPEVMKGEPYEFSKQRYITFDANGSTSSVNSCKTYT